MRVLHVAESYGGGVKSAIDDYVRNSAANEHHLLFSTREDSPLLGEPNRDLRTSRELPLGHLRRLAAIRAAISELNPAVIHAHSSYAGAYVRLAVRANTDRRIVYTPHCYAFERLDLPAPVRLAFRILENILAFNTSAIGACSPRELELSQWRGGRVETDYLPNVPPEKKVAAPIHTSRAKWLLVGAGRDSKQKDPDYFGSLIYDLVRLGHAQEIDAVWVGGDDNLRRRFSALPIRVTGWLPRDEALDEIARADLYVHTARWEGFPVAVLEAAQLGVPTAVRDIRAFSGFDLPLKVMSALDIWEALKSLSDPERLRQHMLQLRNALRMSNDLEQQKSLARLYQQKMTDHVSRSEVTDDGSSKLDAPNVGLT